MAWHKSVYLWFRFARRKALPWLVLTLSTLKLLWFCGSEHQKEQVRLMTALININVVHWLELAQEIVNELPYWFY